MPHRRPSRNGSGVYRGHRFFSPTTALADTATSTSVETIGQKQQALEDQLQQLEGQIDQYQTQITADEQKGTSLTGEISALNAQIAKLNLQIQAINITLEQINSQIADTKSQIAITQGSVADKRTAIGNLLQTLYENDQTSVFELFLENPQLSDLWNNTENISLFEANLSADVTQLDTLAGQLQGQNQQLAQSQSAAATAEAYAAAQAQQVAANKSQENQLLAATKSDETAKQTLVTQTKQTATQIRNQIFQLLGGGSLTFEQAYQYAKVSSQATGVDPALILAVLDRESALGENVGRCSYKTAMSPSNIPVFLKIVQQLGLNPDNMMVSCANADGAYGGAMGPAQFEPSDLGIICIKHRSNHGRQSAVAMEQRRRIRCDGALSQRCHARLCGNLQCDGRPRALHGGEILRWRQLDKLSLDVRRGDRRTGADLHAGYRDHHEFIIVKNHARNNGMKRFSLVAAVLLISAFMAGSVVVAWIIRLPVQPSRRHRPPQPVLSRRRLMRTIRRSRSLISRSRAIRRSSADRRRQKNAPSSDQFA